MAKDKKSFVLYADLIHTVKKMPEDKAGKLLLTILEYVNDENPEVDDMLVDLVFEPIKQQLKRDLIKFEQKRKQWSEAGKRSAEVRKANKNERTLTNVDSRSTDLTVNVSDNVNVTHSKGKKRESFVIPTENEVKEYFKSKGNTTEGSSFYYFYSSKNWMVGKNKMKNWKMSASGWLSRKKENSSKSSREQYDNYKPPMY